MVKDVGNVLGVYIVDILSHRTVSRIILEGLVAVKMQIGFEIAHTQGKTSILLVN